MRLRPTILGAALLFAMLAPTVGVPSEVAAEAAVRNALTQWMADFNARRVDKVCDLFAPDLIAQFRGRPQTDHTALCDQLQRSLTDRSTSYNYGLEIKEILVSGDVAVVRLVWTLKVERAGAPAVTTEETGLDFFRRQPNGSWKIARFIAYD